ncbi:Bromodomain-containing protein [Pisolithus marmoratus]|nr:Bromodomain-containing protein [Pisolithus marmoratus]
MQGDPSEDVRMADPSPVAPAADVASSEPRATDGDPGEATPTTNGINGHPLDADGDITMAQPSPLVNGQTSLTDGKEDPSPSAPTSPPAAASASPYHAETDDDSRPPPAKRARKSSDADQASAAPTASPPPVTASSIQTDGDQGAESPAPPPSVPVSSGISTLSPAQHRFCLSTIRSLKKLKDAAAFLHPVDPIALNIPHYPNIIKNPIDLNTIERKLMSSNPAKPDPNPNNPRYNSADQFIADVRLVFTNCITFNGPDHVISIAGKHVEAVFDKQIKHLPLPAPPTVTKTATPPPPPQPAQPKKASAPPRRPSTSVPVIRRNDNEPAATTRPKREIHPPPPKDLPYADAPKRLRKPKVKDDGTAEQLRFCGKILTDLHRKQHWAIAHPFYEPVDPVKLDIPMYPKVIKKPMDLSTMRRKLENGEYSNATKFFDDFKLMIRNCFAFNPAGTPVNQAGIELQRLFDEKWKNLPPLQEASEEEEEEYEDESEEERKRRVRPSQSYTCTDWSPRSGRIANMEAQIESMRGNLLALKNQPGKEKKKEKKKKEKPSTASTSKASGSRVPKAANAVNGTVKKKSKKQAQDDDILTFEQKKDLSEAISNLEESKLEKVIQIIHEGVPEIRDSTEEIELEIDLLPAHVLTKLYNFVIRPLRQPAQKRSRGTGKGTGTGGLKRKSMDENIEAEKIRQLEERMRLFDQPNSGATSTPHPIARADDSEHSSDSSSDESSGSESE